MLRIVGAVLASALFLLGCYEPHTFDYTPKVVVLQEGEGEAFGPELCPLDEGNFWIYNKGVGPAPFVKHWVAGTGRVFKNAVKRIRRATDNVTVEQFLFVDNVGLWDHGMHQAIYAAPVPRLIFPVRVGKRWRMENKSAELDVRAQVEAVEPVGTPMGVFRAVRVYYSIRGKLSAEEKIWYAPGLGIVLRDGWQRARNEDSDFAIRGEGPGEYDYSSNGRLWYAEIVGYESERAAARIR